VAAQLYWLKTYFYVNHSTDVFHFVKFIISAHTDDWLRIVKERCFWLRSGRRMVHSPVFKSSLTMILFARCRTHSSQLKPIVTPDLPYRFTVLLTTVKRGGHFSDLSFAVKRLLKRFLTRCLNRWRVAYWLTLYLHNVGSVRIPVGMARIIGSFKSCASAYVRNITITASLAQSLYNTLKYHPF